MSKKPKISPIVFTETSVEAEAGRKAAKVVYITNELNQTKAYIKDLESTLTINKEIITEFINSKISDVQSKKVIESLNRENALLQLQVRNKIKERDDAQAKLLIVEQLAESFKKREQEALKEKEIEKLELVDQLNRKELILQSLERKYERIVNVLKNLSHRDPEINKVMKELKINRTSESKVSNVVEINNHLATELEKERQKVRELTNKIFTNDHSFSKDNETLRKDVKKLEKAISPLRLKKEFVPNRVIELLKEEIVKLTKKVETLYEVNTKLNLALKEVSDKLRLACRNKKEYNNEMEDYGKAFLTAKGSNRVKSQPRRRIQKDRIPFDKEIEQGIVINNNKFHDELGDMERHFGKVSIITKEKSPSKDTYA